MEEEKKTARWIRRGNVDDERFECSACGMTWFLAYGNPIENEMFFCPRCGTRMEMDAE